MNLEKQQGQSDRFNQSITQSTQIRQASSIGITLQYEYLKFAITQAYDITISNSVTKTINVDFTSPSGDTYFKLYELIKDMMF